MLAGERENSLNVGVSRSKCESWNNNMILEEKAKVRFFI